MVHTATTRNEWITGILLTEALGMTQAIILIGSQLIEDCN
jgi:hypothetical protein